MSTHVFCTGYNFFGQLGIGTFNRDNLFQPVPFGCSEHSTLSASNVVDIQCGSQCSVVILKDGSIQLTGNVNGTIYPSLTPIEIPLPVKCVQVACGRRHMLLLMERGIVMSWGIGYFGQLGHGDDSSWNAPRIINGLEPRRIGSRVTKVACGGNHSGALTESGKVFMWGLNRGGQCGQSSKSDSVLEPRPIDNSRMGSARVNSLVCGRSHSAALSLDGRVFVWGESGFGRLGSIDVQKFQTFPVEVTIFRNFPVSMIAAGDFHMLALTANEGKVFSWGCGVDGQTGHGTVLNVRTPRQLQFFDDKDVISVECGATWSMAVVGPNRSLYMWGYGDGGWLGMRPPDNIKRIEPDTLPNSQAVSIANCSHFYSFDSRHSILTPQKVRLLADSWCVDTVRAGSGHVVMMCSPRSDSKVVGDNLDVSSDSDLEHLSDLAEGKVGNLYTDNPTKQNSGKIDRSISSSIDSSRIPSQDAGAKLIAHRRENEVSSKYDFKSAPQTSHSIRHDAEGATHTPVSNSGKSTGGINDSSNGISTQLISWCRHKKVAEISAAIAAGTDVNVQDSAGNTPLIAACQNGHFNICKMLVTNGADLNMSNFKGNTALHYSFNYGYEEMGKYLIDCGADEFQTNKEGLTCYEGLTQSDLDLL